MEIVLAAWDGLSGSWFSSCWDEMNFDDDVEGSDQSLGDSGRNQRKIVVRNNYRPVVIRIGKTATPYYEGRFQNVDTVTGQDSDCRKTCHTK